MAFTLWPNFILLVSACVVASIAGFVLYGSIVGFENTLVDIEKNPNEEPEKPTVGKEKENADEE